MTRRKGFTLIELVVIIMILGILAGVAAPKLLKTSGSATDNGLKQTLSIIRDAIELYSSANGGALPPCTGTGTDFRNSLVNYVRGTFPASPVGVKNFDITTTNILGTTVADASPTTGWKFNTADGTFICNSGATSSSGITYDKF
jgi:general secretion pathway protein G